MKKVYLAAMTAIFAAGAAIAAAPQLEQPTEVALTPLTTTTASIHPLASPEGEWVKVSTGIWYEGPLAACYNKDFAGEWEVDVYESATTKGWYRVIPYADGSPMAGNVGGGYNEPIDFCAVDPEKVYFEKWIPYGIEFRTACPEGGFSDQKYGKLTDGVIDLTGCVAYKSGDNWYYLNGSIKLALDKGDIRDYSLDVETPASSTAKDHYFKFVKGSDIATVKLYTAKNAIYYAKDNQQFTADYGMDITAYDGVGVSLGFEGPHNLYSLLYVGLDAAGTVKAYGTRFVVIADEDADNWTSLGEGDFTEAFISETFGGIEPETIKCEIQESKTTPGCYRLVNPYANYSYVANGTFSIPASPEKHYIYVDATDVNHVYIDHSAPGLYLGDSNGDVIFYSRGKDFTGNIEGGEAENVWGKLVDGKITIPAGKTRINLTKFADTFLTTGNKTDIVINLPSPTSIQAIESDNADAPVEYFNLQGMKIENPAAGQVVIRRQGSSVSKIMR